MFVGWLWLKEAFLGLIRNKRWNMTAIFITTSCLFLFGASFVVGLNAKHFAKWFNGKIEIRVDLLESAKNYNEIQTSLEQLPNVKSVKFVSKEEGLKGFKKELGEDADMLDALDKNPLAARFVVKVKNTNNIQQTVNEINKMKIAESVQYGKNFVEKILVSAKALSKFGYICTAVGAIITMIVVFSSIQNNIYQRKNEIRIKQLIGAGFLTIRIPFILEALILMIISSSIVFVSFYFGFPKLMTMIHDSVPYFTFLEPQTVLKKLWIPLGLLALVVGFVGSSLSTYRNINKKNA
jgi:cell division transport system permease protein